MPASQIKSFARKSGKSEKEIEKLWNKAKAAAAKQGKAKNFAYITGTLKKMLGMKESYYPGKEMVEAASEFLRNREGSATSVVFDSDGDLEENNMKALIEDILQEGSFSGRFQALQREIDPTIRRTFQQATKKAQRLRQDLQIAVQKGKMSRKAKSSISDDFQAAGLDGNGRFETPMHGLATAMGILAEYNIELEYTPSNLPPSPEGQTVNKTYRLNYLFVSDFEGEDERVQIKDSMLVMSYYQFSDTTGLYEVLCYLS